jgi:dihydrolipoamide dehydrogenase
MSSEEEEIFDLVIIGSGPGGYHSALRAATFGARVALIEKNERLGGTCSNLGCIPTKALYASAKLIAELKEKASDFGINLTNGFSTDFKKAVERKNTVVQELTTGIAGLLKMRKVSVFKGFGSLVDGNIYTGFHVSVKHADGLETIIKGKRVIIATGSAPAQIPVFNIDHHKILDSDDILKPDFTKVPKSLIIIGGGVIGCEFANIFTEFGAKVTILEFLPTILANEERLIVRTIKKQFGKLDIQLKEGKNVLSVVATETGVKATVCDASIPRDQITEEQKETIEAEMCLVSIGRVKVTKDMGLEKFKIALKRGAILVNHGTMETKFLGIYAIGDCTAGFMMLAHVASYQGDIAVAHALDSIGGFDGFEDVIVEKADFLTIPATTFTHPNIGSVGLRQKEAKEKYGAVNVGRFAYASSGKAKCMGETNGMMMVIADKHTDKIVGASCVGAEAPELISEIAVAMRHGITAHELGSVIHSHPTLSEIVLEAVEDVHGMAIHKARKRK